MLQTIMNEFPITASKERTVVDRQCLEEFELMCQHHDWTYEMSDDHRYWVKGQESYRDLMKTYNEFLEGSLATEAKQIFEHYHCRGWGKRTMGGTPGEITDGT